MPRRRRAAALRLTVLPLQANFIRKRILAAQKTTEVKDLERDRTEVVRARAPRV